MKNELLKNQSNISNLNVRVIENPLNLFEIMAKKNEKCEFYNHTKDCFSILMIGRLVHVKNHILAINALRKLIDTDSINESLKLIICGDGPLKEFLQMTVEKLHLSDNVIFLGNISNPYCLISCCDLGLICSLSEGFSNVLLEMMACGIKYIITTPCTDYFGIKNIHIVNSFDIETMSEAIHFAVTSRINYSHLYYDSVKFRSVDRYWSDIKHSLRVEN